MPVRLPAGDSGRRRRNNQAGGNFHEQLPCPAKTVSSLLADHFILCSAESPPQFEAILDEVQKQTKAAGARCLHVEGEASSGWVLLDYGSAVVHVFDPELRAYYNLEDLWKKARLVVHIQ